MVTSVVLGIAGVLMVAWTLMSTSMEIGPVLVLEKERDVGQHQTGRNSGVVHSGIYYRPGSLKARLCLEGRQRLEAFCDERSIAFEKCGKVIVATDRAEEQRLPALVERGRANGVSCRTIGEAELREREPHVRGRAAILVDDTGVVDFLQVARCLASDLDSTGHEVRCRSHVDTIMREGSGYRLGTTSGFVQARFVLNCAGLHADRVARMAGLHPDQYVGGCGSCSDSPRNHSARAHVPGHHQR